MALNIPQYRRRSLSPIIAFVEFSKLKTQLKSVLKTELNNNTIFIKQRVLDFHLDKYTTTPNWNDKFKDEIAEEQSFKRNLEIPSNIQEVWESLWFFGLVLVGW